MQFSRTDVSFAHELDTHDELAHFRDEFLITGPNPIYFDGNSLGRLPKRTVSILRKAIEKDWGDRLIRGWNDGWIRAPLDLGSKIARVVGAQPEEIIVAETTSVNLFKLAVAALRARPDRRKIVSDVFNFPSDLYVLQGVIDLLGSQHQLDLIPSADDISIAPEAMREAIDSDTALVSLTHVAFKSAFMYDLTGVTKLAHKAGALTLWDLSHSAGAVPLDLNGAGVDMAVGCTYKYLNGGPGAPAFLYVRRDLQQQLMQPIWGWFASRQPFAFDLEFQPANDMRRFWVSTPPVLSMLAIEPGVDLLLEAGVDKLRAKSVRLTAYAIFLAEEWLTPLGVSIGTPRGATSRGSHISLRHADAYRISRALAEAGPPAIQVISDFREPDNIRLGMAPLYTTFFEVHQAVDRIRTIVLGRNHEGFSRQRSGVT